VSFKVVISSASLVTLQDVLVEVWNGMRTNDRTPVTPCLDRLNKPIAFEGFDFSRYVFEFSLEEMRGLRLGLTTAYRSLESALTSERFHGSPSSTRAANRVKYVEKRLAEIPDTDNLVETIGGLTQTIYL